MYSKSLTRKIFKSNKDSINFKSKAPLLPLPGTFYCFFTQGEKQSLTQGLGNNSKGIEFPSIVRNLSATQGRIILTN